MAASGMGILTVNIMRCQRQELTGGTIK